MFRTTIWVLRQRRYAALATLMVVVAGLCALAGTWQVSRFDSKVHDNDALRHNAHAAAVPLTTALVPLVGGGAGSPHAPGRDAIRYRAVEVTGNYVPGTQQNVRNQTLDGTVGSYVLNALRTPAGLLLVVRGFVPNTAAGTPGPAPAPPVGVVHLRGRLQTASTQDDGGKAGQTDVRSVNPTQQAARLDAPVYDAYLTLDPRQPGTNGVTALPAPDLSNPAGGAQEWQHLAYVVQWYLFALLALAAPFAVARHETRDARRRFLGVDPGEDQFDLPPAADAPARTALPAGSSSEAQVALRGGGELALSGPAQAHWDRAVRLADRYGRSLGPGATPGSSPIRTVTVRREDVPDALQPVRNSAAAPHRSEDEFHGAYNDYLWELALADGDLPELAGPATDPRRDDEQTRQRPQPSITPRVIRRGPEDEQA